jgi:hypothetical protein
MWRKSLVIYLLLAAVAGNSPCCCAAARWSGWLATWGSKAADLSDVTGSSAATCCGHRSAPCAVRRAESSRLEHLASQRPNGLNAEPPGPACECEAEDCVGELFRPVVLGRGLGESAGAGIELPALVTSGWDAGRDCPEDLGSGWRGPPPRAGRETRICFCSWRC